MKTWKSCVQCEHFREGIEVSCLVDSSAREQINPSMLDEFKVSFFDELFNKFNDVEWMVKKGVTEAEMLDEKKFFANRCLFYDRIKFKKQEIA